MNLNLYKIKTYPLSKNEKNLSFESDGKYITIFGYKIL